MQYGLYNPETGIIVYGIDDDFEVEPDNFKIVPMKIFGSGQKYSSPP
jgi:hypothetical protein